MQTARTLLATLLAGPLLAGCATEPMRGAKGPDHLRQVARVPSTPALAFTPPAARDIADDLNLDRDGRGPFANAGFESLVVSETYVRQDDRQRFDHFRDDGDFERRAISTTVTVRQR